MSTDMKYFVLILVLLLCFLGAFNLLNIVYRIGYTVGVSDAEDAIELMPIKEFFKDDQSRLPYYIR